MVVIANSVRESLSSFWLNRRTNNNDDTSGTKLSAIVSSQLIALFAASANAASSTLVNKRCITTQFAQMIPMYALLSLQLAARPDNSDRSEDCLLSQKEGILPLHLPWWIFLIISVFFDVFPNFLVLRSICYTSLPSVTLLGALSVPSTMIFSKVLLNRTFRPHQYVGVCLCILGGCLTIWCDHGHPKSVTDLATSGEELTDDASYLMKIWGDLLVVSSAFVYGLGDVVAEQAIKQIDQNEYLGMIGLFGFIQSVIAAALCESQEITKLLRMPSTVQLQTSFILLWYTTSVYAYYRAVAYFLMTSDATLLNLSGQASNVWVILFSVMMYRFMPSALFFLALLLVVWGVFAYEGYYLCLFKNWLDPLNSTGQETNCLQTRKPAPDPGYGSIGDDTTHYTL